MKKIGAKNVIFLTGLRSLRKTTIFKLITKNLLEDIGINPIKIFYISLDDYLL